jgi:hypothetical protein
VGGAKDEEGVVLPVGGLQPSAADFHAPPPPGLGRGLLVLLGVPGTPRGCPRVWAAGR